MKESMAGTWIFGIVALFIVLFSSFIAYSISYTKAFKVKNEILNYIEQDEGFVKSSNVNDPAKMITDITDTSTEAKAARLIDSMGYNSASVSCTGYGEEQYGGYCIAKICKNSEDGTSQTINSQVVYKVTTFIKVNIPVVNINIKLPIKGETKSLYYENVNSAATSCWESTKLN